MGRPLPTLRRLIGRAVRRAPPLAADRQSPSTSPIVPVIDDPIVLFPDLYQRTIQLRLWPWRFGHISNEQALAFLCLLAARGHAPIIEFGTFDGRTTYNLAANVSDGHVYTIDNGARVDDTNAERREYGAFEIGACFRQAEPQICARITQIVGDSRDVDLSALYGRAGLVLIDGGHAEDVCRSDTQRAFMLTRPGGVIVWDDYTPYWPGVAAVVDEIAAVHELFHVPRLGLVVHVRPNVDSGRDLVRPVRMSEA